MRFALTDDQRALQTAVRDFLRRHSSRDDVRLRLDKGGYDHHVWMLMAQQLGVHGVAIAEEDGGGGGSFVELALVLEEIGRALLCSPFFSTVVLAATALQHSGDEDARRRWLPLLASGELVATLAVAEEDGSWSLDGLRTTGRREGQGWRLSGNKEFVVDGFVADLVLVVARTPAGPSLFAVDAAAPGVTREELPVLDPTRPLARIVLDAADAQLVGVEGGAGEVISRVREIAAVALAAEQVGGAQACLDMAVSYVGTRVQFDRPIGSFQAVKHKCADMFVDVETSRALVQYAAWCVSADSDELPLVASLTRAYVSDAYFRTAAQNLQVHGGIGYTWEHDAHLFFKRATTSEQLLGSSQWHREAVAAHIGM